MKRKINEHQQLVGETVSDSSGQKTSSSCDHERCAEYSSRITELDYQLLLRLLKSDMRSTHSVFNPPNSAQKTAALFVQG